MTDPKKALCLDPTWRYTPANSTDIRKTFARARKQMSQAGRPSNVKKLEKRA